MAIIASGITLGTQTWPQLDARDTLGTWGIRRSVVGDGGGGSIKVIVTASIEERAAYVFAVYGAHISMTVGTSSALLKCRILSNWPNIDPDPGVQSYASNNIGILSGTGLMSAPLAGPDSSRPLVLPNDRFQLCYDPRNLPGLTLDIMELEVAENVLNDEYSFEAWGLYWDRSVMQAPGGPRHPGSN